MQYEPHVNEMYNSEMRRRQSVMARYPASWLHAVLSVSFSIVAICEANDVVDAPKITFWFVIMHSFGYFISDILVDRDPVYVAHHLAPMVAVEILVRYHGSFYHAIWFGM